MDKYMITEVNDAFSGDQCQALSIANSSKSRVEQPMHTLRLANQLFPCPSKFDEFLTSLAFHPKTD